MCLLLLPWTKNIRHLGNVSSHISTHINSAPIRFRISHATLTREAQVRTGLSVMGKIALHITIIMYQLLTTHEKLYYGIKSRQRCAVNVRLNSRVEETSRWVKNSGSKTLRETQEEWLTQGWRLKGDREKRYLYLGEQTGTWTWLSK